jgi:ankyrin repeat protein
VDAIKNKQTDCVKMLLEAGASVNPYEVDGLTLFHLACGMHNVEVVELLIEYGADCKSVSIDGRSPMWIASLLGCTDTIKVLVKNGVDVNTTNAKNVSPLQLMCQKDNIDCVRTLLDCGADVNHLSNYKGEVVSPIRLAYENRNFELAMILINYGSDVQYQIEYAMESKHVEGVKLMIEKGIHVPPDSLIESTLTNSYSIAKVLLDNNSCDVDLVMRETTALHAAAHKGYLKLVMLLISHGADVTSDSEKYDSRIAVAIIERLIAAGSELEHRNSHGLTALLMCVLNNTVDLLKVLVKAGAQVDVSIENGPYALNIACSQGYTEIVKVLLKAGANPNAVEKDGRSGMFEACFNGYLDIVKLLIQYNCSADLDISIRLAQEKEHTNVVNYLYSLFNNSSNVLWNLFENNDYNLFFKMLENGVNPNTELHGHSLIGTLMQVRATKIVTAMMKICNYNIDFKLGQKGTAIEQVVKYVRSMSKQHTNPPIMQYAKCLYTVIRKAQRNGCNTYIDHQDDQGKTALYKSALYEFNPLVGALAFNGADPNLLDYKGRTVSIVLCSQGKLETLRLLVKNSVIPVDLNLPDPKNNTMQLLQICWMLPDTYLEKE